jgi:chromosome segregation ATPase
VTADGAGDDCDEQCWRDKFKEKRAAITEAERELDILEREENLARRQHYTDPNQAMKEQYSNSTAGGAELQELQKKITDKKADVQKLKQELQRLGDDLRRAGKPAGWGRE